MGGGGYHYPPIPRTGIWREAKSRSLAARDDKRKHGTATTNKSRRASLARRRICCAVGALVDLCVRSDSRLLRQPCEQPYPAMSNTFPEIAIVNGARTPMGRYCGKLRDFSAMDLGAIAAKEAMQRSGVEPAEIDHCVIGNAQQTSADSIY